MSYTNETTYYGLPLPSGSDKSTFTDNNTAFQAVDAALHTAYEGAAQAASDITSLTGRVGDCETDITNLSTDLGLEKAKIVNLQNKETLQDGEIADVRSDCEDMISAYNEATSTSTHAYSAGDYFIYNDVLYVATDSIAVGDTIVPDTNCETTNVTTELKSQAGDIAQLKSDLLGWKITEKHVVSVNGDGTKTLQTLMNELATACLNYIQSLEANAYVVPINAHFSSAGDFTNNYQQEYFNTATSFNCNFDKVISGSSEIRIYHGNVSNSSVLNHWAIGSSYSSYVDDIGITPSSASSVYIQFNVFKRVV